MSIPRQSAVYDESRNTSRVRPPSPTAVADAIAACVELRRRDPALVRWIEAGAPALSEDDHLRLFGAAHAGKPKRKSPSTAPAS